MDNLDSFSKRFEDLKDLTSGRLKGLNHLSLLFKMRKEAEVEYSKTLSRIGTSMY